MGRQNPSAEWIGKKYQAAIRAFSRQLGDPSLRLSFTQEADPFFRRCALGVWARGGAITEDQMCISDSLWSARIKQKELTACWSVSTSSACPPQRSVRHGDRGERC